jgi:hypothetical protein
MTLTMSHASIPLFRRYLTALSRVLDKAEEQAKARKIDPSTLLNARLFPDMFSLTSQVQSACDFAKGAAARLAGVAVPSFRDDEASFEALRARIAKTLDVIGAIDPARIDGSETRDIAMKFGGNDLAFTGERYLIEFALPNMIFHTSIAYAILRHNGIDIGKSDFLGGLDEWRPVALAG